MRLLDWLLGLGGGAPSAEDGGLALSTAPPAWAWVAIAVGAVGVGVLAYRRTPGPRAWRAVAAGLRAVAVLAVVWLLCGPQWVQERERVEPDVVAVLVDRSASLLTEDAQTPGGLGLGGAEAAAGGRVSRDAALRAALEAEAAAFAGLAGERRRVRWLGFGSGAFPLTVPEEGVPTPGPADREATALVGAVLEAAADPSGAPVAAVVVLSDGRTPDAVGPAAEALLAAAGVPVVAVPLGPDGAAADAGIGSLAAPPRAFRGDRVPVSVEVTGAAGLPPGEPVTVRLVEPGEGDEEAVLDERTLTAEQLAAAGGRVRLRGAAREPGERAWAVRVEPVAGERNLGNNRGAVTVDVLDRPLSVLYAEGPPRWEYRYLKNLLLREASVESSVLLFSADAAFVPEGDRPIARFPSTAEELRAYDVVVLGDVEPGHLSEEQEELLVERVSGGGGGVLFVGGPRRMPAAWAGRPLAELLPMADPAAVAPAAGTAFAVRTGPLAESLSVLDLMDGRNGPAAGVGAGTLPLPPLRSVQELGPLKPLAETLAFWDAEGEGGAEGSSGGPGGSGPLVVRMRAGAGQSLYTATDGAWAWRRGVGERYPERYFLQMLRLLGRGAAGGGGPVELAVADRRLLRGGTTAVELRLRDGGPGDAVGDAAAVAVRRIGREDDAETVGELRLEAEDASSGGERTLRTLWSPDRAGRYRLEPVDPVLARLGVGVELEVVANADERRDTATDHPKLAAIAAATGGRVVPLDSLGSFLRERDAIESVARLTPDDRAASLRTSPLALLLVLLPLFGEWGIRRFLRQA